MKLDGEKKRRRVKQVAHRAFDDHIGGDEIIATAEHLRPLDAGALQQAVHIDVEFRFERRNVRLILVTPVAIAGATPRIGALQMDATVGIEERKALGNGYKTGFSQHQIVNVRGWWASSSQQVNLVPNDRCSQFRRTSWKKLGLKLGQNRRHLKNSCSRLEPVQTP